VFDKAELAAFETLMRPRFEAAGAEPSSWPYRPEDCLAVAKPMVGRKSADALGRVERSSADGPWSER